MPRLLLPFNSWPDVDRELWLAATRPGRRRRFTQRRPADRYGSETLIKVRKGYSRWLGFRDGLGRLDPAADPASRVTPELVVAWVDDLKAHGNRDTTVIGRLSELWTALRILAPEQDFRWLTRVGGVPLREQLSTHPRSFEIHHPRRLYKWGMRLMREGAAGDGPLRSRRLVRDGLMIALLASRAPRLRSLASLRLKASVLRQDGRWVLDMGERDIKTRRPLAYQLPAGLSAWMDRYVDVERLELLAGRTEDALWIDREGKAMTPDHIASLVRRLAMKQFGGGGFGPHRFRHAIGTLGPIEDPEAPGASAAILGISARVHRLHYDRGARGATGPRFNATLRQSRDETAVLARRHFEKKHGQESAGWADA
jgi:site-specific recombinase XerD